MFRTKKQLRRLRHSGVVAAAVLLAACGGGSQSDLDNLTANEGQSETTLLAGTTLSTSTGQWGTFLNPFAADSLWNSRPVNPVFGTFVIPTSSYYPSVSEGTWSTGAFEAKSTDKPMTVRGYPYTKGLMNSDSETYRDVTLPRWPANVVPAVGADGHADIIDPISGIVHSFFKLKYENGQWIASQYAWSKLNGRGWGDPAHYYQGSRATAVSTIAGVIRKHEIKDGQPIYRHALAMSMTFNGLSPNPTYQFPATSADYNAATTNTGQIPQGSLMMLPPSFNAAAITNPDLRKVAETLKVYGAYVVDRNHGTPFSIYVENGSGFSLHNGGWNSTVANDLQKIRAAMRQVVSTSGWVDGNGLMHTPEKNLNMLSMRGTWQISSGSVAGTFDSWQQAVVFPTTATKTVMVNYSNRGMNSVTWGSAVPGAAYQLTGKTTGGGKLRFQLYSRTTGGTVYDSGELANGAKTVFTWPSQTVGLRIYAISGVGMPSTVSGEILAVPSSV